MGDDVQPIPLDDGDDFFSDIGSDDPHTRHPVSTIQGRLVLDIDGSQSAQRNSRINPFTASEIRTRNFTNSNINNTQNDRASSNRTQIPSEAVSSTPLPIPESHCHIPHLHEPNNVVRNQLIAISVVTILFMIGEGVGAIVSNSIAIGTDCMHLGSDLLSFVISLIAIHLTKKNSTSRYTWGFYRAEVLGAILSVFVIWLVTGILVYLAAERIIHNTYTDIVPKYMLITSAIGVLFNIIMGIILNVEMCKCQVSHGHSHGGGDHGHGHSHGGASQMRKLSRSRNNRSSDREILTADDEDNDDTDIPSEMTITSKKEKNIVIRAAFVHVIGDLIQSIGVLVAAIIIQVLGAEKAGIADPICTFIFSVLVLITTINVLRDSFHILMEGRPASVSYDAMYLELSKLRGVKSVHSLRIWLLTSNEISASVHIIVDDTVTNSFDITKQATKVLREGGFITRTTVQVEQHEEAMTRCRECLFPPPAFPSA